MGKIVKFWALLLVVVVSVQHIQLERIKEQERENWRQFRIEMDARQADAAAPVVAVGLAAAAPFLLAALVTGTVAYWCWSHGGKESLLQLAKATKNGVVVTKYWVQKQIAELHGIDTTPAQNDFGHVLGDGYIIIDSQKYYINENLGCTNFGPDSQQVNTWYGMPSPWISSSYGVTTITYATNSFPWNGAGGQLRYNSCTVRVSAPVPAVPSDYPPNQGFNPADYPHLWVGPGLLTDCHKVMEKNPDIELWVLPVPERPSDVPESSITTVPLAAKLFDGSLVDADGRKWMAPFPPPTTLGLPTLEDGKVASVSVAPPKDNNIYPPVALPGEVIIPKPVADVLGGFVPAGSKINGLTHIGGNVANPALEWINAEGETVVTPIPQELAAQLAGSIPVAASATAVAGGEASQTVIHPNNPEKDPGDPADIPLPDLPVFDPTMDWGDEEPWPWESWIGSLPFIDVLKSSSINLSGATSVISCDLSFAGKSRNVSYDFSEWSGLLNSMGLLIYACACWYSLQLALLKRD